MNKLSIEELKLMRQRAIGDNWSKEYISVFDELITIREMKGDRVPVAYLIHGKAKPARLSFQNLKGFVSQSDIEEHELWQEELFTAPQKPVEDYFSSLVAMGKIAAEKAMRKYPQPNYVLLKVAEEAGEVVQAAVHYAENRMTWAELEGEVIQLIAMLNRLMVEGDQVNGVKPPQAIEAAGCIVKDGE